MAVAGSETFIVNIPKLFADFKFTPRSSKNTTYVYICIYIETHDFALILLIMDLTDILILSMFTSMLILVIILYSRSFLLGTHFVSVVGDPFQTKQILQISTQRCSCTVSYIIIRI